MKKRLVPKKHIQRAYTKDLSLEDLNIKEREKTEDIDSLPKEMFEILGQVISFIESTNKIEGEQNENK